MSHSTLLITKKKNQTKPVLEAPIYGFVTHLNKDTKKVMGLS